MTFDSVMGLTDLRNLFVYLVILKKIMFVTFGYQLD